MRILIVEDDFPFALEVEIQLKELGFNEVFIEDNSKSALEKIHSESIDLLIIDVNLNDRLEGVSLANKISDDKIPIIFVTGLNDEQTFQEAMLANPSGFLVKPFDKITLQSCIDRVLNKELSKHANAPLASMMLDDCFFVKQKDVLNRVEFEDILWIEADGNYIVIQLDKKKFITKMSLTKVEQKMNVPYFVRAHKKFLINIKKVDNVNSVTELSIQDNSIPIGPKFRNDLLQTIRLADY